MYHFTEYLHEPSEMRLVIILLLQMGKLRVREYAKS